MGIESAETDGSLGVIESPKPIPLTNNMLSPVKTDDGVSVQSEAVLSQSKIDIGTEPVLGDDVEAYITAMQEYNALRIKAAAAGQKLPEAGIADQNDAIEESLEKIKDSAESEYKPNEKELENIASLNKKIKELETEIENMTIDERKEKDIELVLKKAKYQEQVVKYIEGDSEKDQLRYGIEGSAGSTKNEFVREAKEVTVTLNNLRESGKISDIVQYLQENIEDLKPGSADAIAIKNLLQSKIDQVLHNKAENNPEKLAEARQAIELLNLYAGKLGVNMLYLKNATSDSRINPFTNNRPVNQTARSVAA
jgi:hypothetical protein